MKHLLALLSVVLLAVVGACQTQEPAPTQVPGQLEVHFVDVGQGDGIFIRSPEGLAMVIDGGPRNSGFADYLANHRVKEIAVLVRTHPEADHIGGLIEVLRRFKVKSVWLDGQLHTTRTYDDFLSAIERSGAAVQEARRGQVITLGELRFQVLHPSEPFLSGDLDENSVILRLVFGGVSFLFTGDAGRPAEESMLATGLDLQADILKVGHHGSSTSTSPLFMQAVSPEVAIYQAGRDNPYGHPHAEVVTTISLAGVKLYGTNVDGTLVVRSDGRTYTIQAEP